MHETCNTIMDEAVAKREARRRRILENSERRLQRITGRNNQNEFEDGLNKVTDLSIQSNILDLQANGISLNKAFIQNENDKLYFQGNTIVKHRASTSNKSCFGLSNDDTLFALSNSYKCNDIINDKYDWTNEKSNVKHLSNHIENTEYLQEKSNTSYQLQPNIYNKYLLLSNLLSNYKSYVVLAVIVNILLMCKMDYLFGKGIIVPYFIVVLARLCTCANIQESSHGSLLIATLILCNIKPELTYRFTWVMRIFTTVITDLALYIFSFTLIYYAITHYLQEFYILIVSSM